MNEHETSHGDILRAIGNLEGKIDTFHQGMANNRTDINDAVRRLNKAEQRIAQGVILAATISLLLSIIMPIAIVKILQPPIEFIDPSQPHNHERSW
mgnify:CR=1 FL=1